MKKKLMFCLSLLVLLVMGCPNPNLVTVTFYPNGGSGKMSPQVFELGVAQPLAANAFVGPEGKVFDGWAETPDGAALYQDKANFNPTQTMVLYAVWKVELTTDNAAEKIKTLSDGFHSLSISGKLTKDKLNDIVLAIGSKPIKVSLDLSKTKGLDTLNTGVFSGLTKLISIVLPDSITKILTNAFLNCTLLKKVILPAQLQSIGPNAFQGCVSLSAITFPETLNTIDQNSFESTGLTSVVIPKAVTTITSGAFENCLFLKKVDLPSTLKNIDKDAFAGCTALTTINFPENLLSIGSAAFAGCSSLVEVKLLEGLGTLGDNAFKGTAIKSIVIPKSIKEIGACAFDGCTSLESVTLQEELTTIGMCAFQKTKLKEIDLPTTITTLEQFICAGVKTLESITVRFTGAEKFTASNFNDLTALKDFYCPKADESKYKTYFDSKGKTNITITTF